MVTIRLNILPYQGAACSWCCYGVVRRGKAAPLCATMRLGVMVTARAHSPIRVRHTTRGAKRPVHDFELACGSRRQGSAVTLSAQRAVLARPDPSEHHLGDANRTRAGRRCRRGSAYL